jgi:hypothetical protein
VFSGYYDAQIMMRGLVDATGSTSLFWTHTNIDRVDRVLAKLCSKSIDQIVFEKSQLRCPRWIGNGDNEGRPFHCNRTTLCSNSVTNQFGPTAKNSGSDIGRWSTEMTHEAIKACVHRHGIAR